MEKIWKMAAGNQMVRYLFFGGCTTLVNLGVFSVLRYAAGVRTNPANFVSIIAAILFAFWVNRQFVFRREAQGARRIGKEFMDFVGMRLVTMLVEFWGVALMVGWLGIPDFAGKLIAQILVIILNYIISKFFVFREQEVSV